MRRHDTINGTLFLLLIASMLFPQLGFAENFAIPGHGSLQMAVPKGWKVSSKSNAQPPPSMSLLIRPDTGDVFDLQITTVWLDSGNLEKATPESRKSDIEMAGRQLLSQAVEKNLVVRELRGVQASGHYFMLTDRAPGPGEHKYIVHGSVLHGALLSVFTVLYRTPETPEVEQILQMFASATYSAK